MSASAFFLLGSNQGDAPSYLIQARDAITRQIGNIRKASSIYKTSAWGKTDQPDFLNQVIEVLLERNFAGSPSLLLSTLLDIEKQMGRVRIEKWGTRSIDIDILFFGNQIIDDYDLQIPHPQIPFRRFTLIPLSEIAPDFIHPVLLKSTSQLLNECVDPLEVNKMIL